MIYIIVTLLIYIIESITVNISYVHGTKDYKNLSNRICKIEGYPGIVI